MAKPRLVLFNKPYLVLTQFTDSEGRPTLADFLPEGEMPALYPAGRLDYDSEGLVLLTNTGWLQHLITHPRYKLPKTYWVQVEGQPGQEELRRLQQGLQLKDGPTLPAQAVLVPEPSLWPRDPPIRERRDIPTAWIEITLKEGRKRQVRRMTAAVGFPTLRLIRRSIGPWSLDQLQPGEWREEAGPPDRESYFKQVLGR